MLLIVASNAFKAVTWSIFLHSIAIVFPSSSVYAFKLICETITFICLQEIWNQFWKNSGRSSSHVSICNCCSISIYNGIRKMTFGGQYREFEALLRYFVIYLIHYFKAIVDLKWCMCRLVSKCEYYPKSTKSWLNAEEDFKGKSKKIYIRQWR